MTANRNFTPLMQVLVVIVFLYSNPNNTHTDSLPVDSLRIVVQSDSLYLGIDSLSMSPDEDTLIFVQGYLPDNDEWVFVNADWHIDNPSVTENSPPQSKHFWQVFPAMPAKGAISVSFNTFVDTLSYRFYPPWGGRPEFLLLTPDSLCIAGQRLTAEARIYDNYGLIPGITKFNGTDNPKAFYLDTLDHGGLLMKPGVITSHGGAELGVDSTNQNGVVEQWFKDGVDTLEFVIYWAATSATENQKKHKLRMWLNYEGTRLWTDPTREFYLKPAPLDTIKTNPDTLPVMTPNDGPYHITASGYDEYGNYIPDEPFIWTSDPSLVDFNINIKTNKLVFDPGAATVSQEGYLTITLETNPAVYKRLLVRINTGTEVITAFQRNKPPSFRHNNNNNILRFSIPSSSFVNLSIYDTHGRLVKTLINDKLGPGKHSISLKGSRLSIGVYYALVSVDGSHTIRKLFHVK